MNFGLSMLCFWGAYIVVTIIGILHTCYNSYVLKIVPVKGEKIKPSQVPAYLKTIPFHILYNIIIFPIVSYVYLKQVMPINLWREALIIGSTWALITIIFDLLGWVIIKHPWSMTFKEMYVDYQPYITMIYIAIFLSPFIAAILY